MRFLIVALIAIGMVASSSAARADKRVAFVVGNGAYRNVPTLPNPPRDAAAMATTLRNAGFDIVDGTNLTRDEMTEKLLDFGRKAQDADIALFYYAGHGLAIDGVNYLLPVDADIKSEMDVKLGTAFNVDVTLDQTMGDAKVKLVFLDACRDNPFAARIRSASTRGINVQSGLAEMKSGEGTLIAFATGPGQTALDGDAGRSSPFTRALIAHLTQPGVEIQQAMTEVRAQVNEETNRHQLPWDHTNLIGSVYLDPAEPRIASAGVPALAGPNSTRAFSAGGSNEVELEFWRSVRDSKKAEELNAYLTSYPNGQFRSLALARIAALENAGAKDNENDKDMGRNVAAIDPATYTEEANQTTEDQIGLDRGQRREVQRRLTGLGFDTKINGKFDEQTRSVITRWQAARGYPASGYLNNLQHKALLSEIVANLQSDTKEVESHPNRHHEHTSSGRRYYRSSGGGGGFPLFGGMMGGLFGRH